MQQYDAQLQEGISAPTPYTQVIQDLSTFIVECKEKGDEIILCLDANEEIKAGEHIKNGTITHLTQNNSLICAHEYLGDRGGTSEKSGKG